MENKNSKTWVFALLLLVGFVVLSAGVHAGNGPLPPVASECPTGHLVMLTAPGGGEGELEIWYVVAEHVESVNSSTTPGRVIVRTSSGLEREVFGSVEDIAAALGLVTG